MNFLFKLAHEFAEGWNSEKAEEKMRKRKTYPPERLSERQIDNMIRDSFPASDPPSTY